MPKRSSTDDPNVSAFNIVREATGETPPTGPDAFAALIREIAGAIEEGEAPESVAKRLWPRIAEIVRSGAAAELGRKGGKKGGQARAKKLSAERKKEIARKAAEARWGKKRDGQE